jgi:hypothetical protein
MTHPAPARHAIHPAALWFGLFAAPLLWSAQELASYALVAHACYPRTTLLGAPMYGAEGLAIVVGVVALAVGVAAGLTAYRAWRVSRTEDEGEQERLLDVGEGRTRFMAFAGLLLSSLFSLAIAFNLGAIFLLPTCL